MPRSLELTLTVAELSFRVLKAPHEEVLPAAAAVAVRDYLERERPALAGALKVSAGRGGVVLQAEGEAPQELLSEAAALLRRPDAEPPAGELEVDPAEFGIEVAEDSSEPEPGEREVLTSAVRYFPYPECEWFEVRDGRLTLTERRILFEPKLIIAESPDSEAGARHVTPLSELERAYRDEWLAVPCLMVQTPRITYRYGWPARRGELELIFDVDEWLRYIRSLTQQTK
jgi:hypothetical protein